MGNIKTVFEDCEIIVVGGGMAGTGAAFEARYWGRNMKIVCVEKEVPNKEALDSQLLYSEPKGLNIDTGLPEMKKERFKQGVYY